MSRKDRINGLIISFLCMTLAGCTLSAPVTEETEAVPVTQEEIKEVIWAVDPDEGLFDSYEEVTILNGMIDQGFETINGVKGYPSQWASKEYSGNVLKVKQNSKYNLIDYYGDKLLDEFRTYIGNPAYVAFSEDNYIYSGDKILETVILTSDTEPRHQENSSYKDTIELSELDAGFNEVYTGLTWQNGEPQANDTTWYVEGETIYEVKGDGSKLPVTQISAAYNAQSDYLIPKREGDKLLGYVAIENGTAIKPLIPYQPTGIMVNGIVAIEENLSQSTTYSRNMSDEQVNQGIMAEGNNLGVYNAYDGELLSDFVYDAIGACEEGYVPVRQNGKWGLLDIESKEMVIPCILNAISTVYGGMVYVDTGEGRGVLDLEETLAEGISITMGSLTGKYSDHIETLFNKIEGLEGKGIYEIIALPYRTYWGSAMETMEFKGNCMTWDEKPYNPDTAMLIGHDHSYWLYGTDGKRINNVTYEYFNVILNLRGGLNDLGSDSPYHYLDQNLQPTGNHTDTNFSVIGDTLSLNMYQGIFPEGRKHRYVHCEYITEDPVKEPWPYLYTGNNWLMDEDKNRTIDVGPLVDTNPLSFDPDYLYKRHFGPVFVNGFITVGNPDEIHSDKPKEYHHLYDPDISSKFEDEYFESEIPAVEHVAFLNADTGEQSPYYENAKWFQEGIAPVKLNDKWGYINTDYEVVVPFVFDSASVCGSGKVILEVQGKYYSFDLAYAMNNGADLSEEGLNNWISNLEKESVGNEK